MTRMEYDEKTTANLTLLNKVVNQLDEKVKRKERVWRRYFVL